MNAQEIGRTTAQYGVIVAMTASLVACASAGACDPTRTDLFTGIGCQVGGGYGARTSGLVAQRDAADQEKARQVSLANQAYASRTEAERALADRQRRLADLRRQTGTMQARLDAARQRAGSDAGSVARAQEELNALRQQQNALPAAPSEAEIRAVEQRRQDVLRLIKDM